MKTYGVRGWEEYPSYFPVLIPYVLDILDRFNLKITFFAVGRDIVPPENATFLKMVANEGHEIGNHSFNHEPWFRYYQRSRIQREILETEEYIFRNTGKRSVGFRGPGFSWSKDLFQALFDNGYIYDSTVLPTYLGPVARTYYFRGKTFGIEDNSKRKTILEFREGKWPIKPYYWKLPFNGKLLEIPISTIPLFKSPFHMSYLLFLGRVSIIFMMLYFRFALGMCLLTQTAPSFVIHPTDLLGIDQVPDMKFFPGMDLSSALKLRRLTAKSP
jgi:hypothetical protein